VFYYEIYVTLKSYLQNCRYAEKHKVHGIVLVSACITDLGDANETASGNAIAWPFFLIPNCHNH